MIHDGNCCTVIKSLIKQNNCNLYFIDTPLIHFPTSFINSVTSSVNQNIPDIFFIYSYVYLLHQGSVKGKHVALENHYKWWGKCIYRAMHCRFKKQTNE